MSAETILAAVLTFMIWSYILGDNPAFRIAEHILVGTAAGYVAVLAWGHIIWPALHAMWSQPSPATVLPFLLCALLAARPWPLLRPWAAVSLAFLIGVGSALAVGGALFGTLWSQVLATASLSLNPADWDEAQMFLTSNAFWQNLAIVIGTIGTFCYFTFRIRPGGPLRDLRAAFIRFWSGVGLWMMMITLGALFASAAMSRFTLLIDRVQWLLGIFELR
ncbi:MAG: hypothetical protein DDG58_08880 [Ardenticatenia bacterium]|nr:MAG: hypothetical protein DDG58_08880 [Ardenticatenia bacterium]